MTREPGRMPGASSYTLKILSPLVRHDLSWLPVTVAAEHGEQNSRAHSGGRSAGPYTSACLMTRELKV